MKFWEGNFAIWGAFDRESKVRKMIFSVLPPPHLENDRVKILSQINGGSTFPTQFSMLNPNLASVFRSDAWLRRYSRKTIFHSKKRLRQNFCQNWTRLHFLYFTSYPTQFSSQTSNLQTASFYDAWFRSYSRKTVFQSQNPFFTQKND